LSVASHSRQYDKLVRDIRFLKAALKQLSRTESAEDRHGAYIQYVRQFKSSADLLRDIAICDQRTKGFGHKVNNELSKNRILKYLVVTRNVEDHSGSQMDPMTTDVSGGEVVVNKFISVQSVGKLSIIDCVIDGEVVSGEITVQDGKTLRERGNLTIAHVGGNLSLLPVRDQQGVLHEPPIELAAGSNRVELKFCEIALRWIEEKYDELDALLLKNH
jgi:hypothetical protein